MILYMNPVHTNTLISSQLFFFLHFSPLYLQDPEAFYQIIFPVSENTASNLFCTSISYNMYSICLSFVRIPIFS